MWWIFGSLAAGTLAGVALARVRAARALGLLDRAVFAAVGLLLFSLGLLAGGNPEVIANAGRVGGQALVLAVTGLLGSVALAPLAFRLAFPRRPGGADPAPDARPASRPPALSPHTLGTVAAFLVGAGVGWAGWWPLDAARTGTLSTYALSLLLALVGATVGGDEKTWRRVAETRPAVLLIPILSGAGTLAATATVSLALPRLGMAEAAGIGAGMGYYSLSSLIITQIAGPVLGVTALLTNLSREALTLLLAPWLVRWLGPIAPMAAGGATTMDVTLPMTILYAGKEYALASVLNGLVLTIAVPFLVTMIFRFA